MREELLAIIEKNSRIDLKELAVILGVEEIDVVNELAALEAEGIICGYHTLINWEKTDIEKVSALIIVIDHLHLPEFRIISTEYLREFLHIRVHIPDFLRCQTHIFRIGDIQLGLFDIIFRGGRYPCTVHGY